MRKIKKKLKRPLRPWDEDRIREERVLSQKFGLRRKREIWKYESILRNFRRRARIISAKNDKQGEKTLLEKMYNMGILEKKDVELDEVLDLKLTDILKRRLQTIVFEKGLANTPKQARQFIVHGHISVDGKRTVFPGYIVPRELEGEINYYGDFKLKDQTKKAEKKEDEGEEPTQKKKKESPEPKEEKKSKTPEKDEKSSEKEKEE
jgi:small subunit ribosomal protein S4